MPSPRFLNADRTLRYCILAFGRPRSGPSEESPWMGLVPRRLARMEASRDEVPKIAPDLALRILQRSHEAQAHVDLNRVHPSWLSRASHDESPAVKRLLTAGGPVLGVDPRVTHWVRSLGTERLVGGEPTAINDAPVIVVLTGLPLRSVYRLTDAIGRAKLILAGLPDRSPGVAWDREQLCEGLDEDEAELRALAEEDIHRASLKGTTPRRRRSFSGLLTLARLLAGCEPFRIRWALQHLPYPIAKRVRTLMASSSRSPSFPQRIDERLLQTACERLSLKYRVPLTDPAEQPRSIDAP